MDKLICLDCEVLPNYFLVAIKSLRTGKVIHIDVFGEHSTLSKDQVNKLGSTLKRFTSFGFNSLKYDMPIINLALKGYTCKQIHKVSKAIIENNQPDWLTYRNEKIKPKPFDHFDVSEPSPAVMISLKNYGTRIGSAKLQEFYLDPHEPITEEQVEGLISYCENDLNVTIDLYNAIEDRIALRVKMGEEYGLDLRSKSDAQIAETVISSELIKQGIDVYKPELKASYKATYTSPNYVEFKSPQLQELQDMVNTLSFDLASNGAVKMPKELSNKKIVIGSTTYKMGIGGLHSQEKSVCYESNDTHVMRNADFASYYPAIILTLGLFPKHLSGKFLGVYGKIRSERLYAKAKVKELEKELEDVLSQTK